MSAPSASPIPRAATIGRIEFRPSMASRKPPISPTTFDAGTRTSSRISSPVSMPRTPILSLVRPTDTPGHESSTLKHEMSSCLRESAGPVLANTQYQSACTTPDIQHLVPLSTQSSPSTTALVRIPTTSLPACGSDNPKPARSRPSATARTYRCRCSSLPAIRTGPVGSRVRSSMSAAVFEYLATSSIASVRPRIPAPPPPYSSGITRPSSPASRNTSKTSCGYVASVSMARARGATFSWASLRTVAWSSAYSAGRSKDIARHIRSICPGPKARDVPPFPAAGGREEARVAGTDDHIDLSTRAQTRLPGDDIAVVPGPPPGRPRRLLLVIAAIAVVVVAGGIAAAVALSSSGGSTRVRTDAAADVTPATLAPPATDAPTTASIPPTTASSPPTTAAASQPTTARGVVPPAGPPVAAPKTPVTEMRSSPLSTLAWKATPASLTISTGKTETVTVAAHNSSLGVVALPHPLSC